MRLDFVSRKCLVNCLQDNGMHGRKEMDSLQMHKKKLQSKVMIKCRKESAHVKQTA